MTSDRTAKIQSAIEGIRTFHKVGGQVPKKSSRKNGYGTGVIDDEAKKHGLNPDTMRKARQFADPESGYTKKEVKELCRLIRDEQSEQDGSVFGRTHVIRLLSVPKKKRCQVQEKAIKNGWSTAELEAHIASRFGSRRDGGRKRRVPTDLPGVLVQLDGMCEGWQRWAEVAVGDDSHVPERKVSKRAELPTGLFQSIVAVTQAIADLHAEISRELQSHRPKRGLRKRFRVEEEA